MWVGIQTQTNACFHADQNLLQKAVVCFEEALAVTSLAIVSGIDAC